VLALLLAACVAPGLWQTPILAAPARVLRRFRSLKIKERADLQSASWNSIQNLRWLASGKEGHPETQQGGSRDRRLRTSANKRELNKWIATGGLAFVMIYAGLGGAADWRPPNFLPTIPFPIEKQEESGVRDSSNKALSSLLGGQDPDFFPRQGDQLQKLKKLQSTDQEMLAKLDRQMSQRDSARPLVENLKGNLEEERRAIQRERGERDKLRLELRLNKISQVSLGFALLAFITERQSTNRKRLEEEEEERQRQEAEQNKTTTIFDKILGKDGPVSTDSSSAASSAPSSKSQTAQQKSQSQSQSSPFPFLNNPNSEDDAKEVRSKDDEAKVTKTAVRLQEEPLQEGGGWWRGIKSWTGNIFQKAKGTIKKRAGTIIERRRASKKDADHETQSIRKVPKRESVHGSERQSIWGRASTRVRKYITRDLDLQDERHMNRRSGHGRSQPSTSPSNQPRPHPLFFFKEGGGTMKRRLQQEAESSQSASSSIRVRILWKSAKTFWTWRQLSVVDVQIRGQLFLRFQSLLQDVVSSTGWLEGVEEGLSKLITWSVAKRLYANPVDQNVEYAYQVLRGEESSPIIQLPRAEDIQNLEDAKKRTLPATPPPIAIENESAITGNMTQEK